MEPVKAFFLLLGVALGAALMTGRVRRYALCRLLDMPNARSSHAQPTPRGGGLALVLAFSFALVSLMIAGFLPLPLFLALSGLAPLAAIGFLDDHGHVPARWRFLIQVAAAVWALAWMGGPDTLTLGGTVYRMGWAGYGFGVLFIVWMLNLFNFMDGIDGIAGGETVTLTLSAAWLMGLAAPAALPAAGYVALALAAATAGFLAWNWPPAKIFMGDVGSGVLGYVLAVLALWSAGQNLLSLAVWLILAGVFWVDATLTLLIRMRRGERWYAAHRSHAYQHAAHRSGSHRRVTLGVLAINLAWLLPLAWVAVRFPAWEGLLLALAWLPLGLLAFRLDAGKS